MRDNFTKQTVLEIAKGVGFRCSNPDCMRPTVAANEAQDDTLIIGDAAHICAASENGPRYNPAQTQPERRAKENGIWLCKVCARLVDLDSKKYTEEVLRKWKRDAQAHALREMLSPVPSGEATRVEALIVEANSSNPPAGFSEAFTSLHAAATADLNTYKRSPAWSSSQVELTLTIYDDPGTPPFKISELPLAVELAPLVTIIAPPGTGKTTTLLQVAGHVLARYAIIPLYFRLGDWATGSLGLLASIRERRAFRAVSEADLELLAERGRLLLLLDGWNEIGAAAQQKLRIEIDTIRREFPDVRIIVTTRRQALDVPISGPRIEIEPLSEDRQLEIARNNHGDAGERVIDDAWRDSGLRELVARPLYLNTLLSVASSGSVPTTKEELLRLFVARHEGSVDHAQALYAVLSGRQTEVMTALASQMTVLGPTTLTDEEARRVVSATLSSLRAQGQLAVEPEPRDVLEVLTSHHTLLRAANGAISFQHQQFQEWYASREVYALMRASAGGDRAALQRLLADIFDQPAWEEAILFGIDRLSRESDGPSIVAKAIMYALPVDPMLAAEMIYRSPVAVWAIIRDDIQAFVQRWHSRGEADRAALFMVTTGRPEFEPLIWPLASSKANDIPTLRSTPRFRPGVLGSDLRSKVAALPEQPRERLLTMIAADGGVDGMDLATDLALADPSPKIQAEVVQYLLFRRADRYAVRLLNGALDETRVLVAARGYAEEIRNPAAAERLRAERDKLIQESSGPRQKLGLLLKQSPAYPGRDAAITETIADARFPVRDQHGGSGLHFAQKRAPAALLSALRTRLERGLELPFGADDLLRQLPVVDEGAIVASVLDDSGDSREALGSAVLAGPKTVGVLLEKYVTCALALKAARDDRSLSDKHFRLSRRIGATRATSFVPGLIAKANQDDPAMICELAWLVTHHGNDDEKKIALQVPAALKDQIIGVMKRWVECVLTSPAAKRCHLYPVANAIGRLGYRELIPELKRLLDEDIARLGKAREGLKEALQRHDVEAASEARTGYANQYQAAFARIGGEEVASIAATYLENPLFSVEAAHILQAVANEQPNVAAQIFHISPPFGNVAAARAARAAPALPARPNRSEIAIFEAIGRLGRPENDRDSQLLAIRLGAIALMMPHTNRDREIEALMALPQPLSAKLRLLMAMVLDGVVLDASLIMEGIDSWLQEAGSDETKAWHKRQHTWEIEPWLELLPFTDRPQSIVDGMAKVKAFYGAGHRQHFDRVVSAVAKVPGAQADALLAELVRTHTDIADDHTWIRAILGRDTVSATLLLLDLVAEGVLGRGPHAVNGWYLTQQVAPLAKKHAELKTELDNRYRLVGPGPARALLEGILGEIGGSDNAVAMVSNYAANERRIDGGLARALRGATIWQDPVRGSQNIYYERPASVAKLRKFLFDMTDGTDQKAALAARCLVVIDALRDEHGIAAGDPRHPDIRSGRPWPPEAGQVGA